MIVGTGTICLFACLGFGRFALGMLLPSMEEPLGLSYAEMGLISTANFLGYLVSVLASGIVTARIGPRRLIFAALLLTGLSMFLVSRAEGFLTVAILYTITGIGSGAANIPMMALVSSWFAPVKRGRAAGFVVTGSGFAILLSGWMIPKLNAIEGGGGWRLSWLVSALIVGAAACICFAFLRDGPEEMGLARVGQGGSVSSRGMGRAGSTKSGRLIAHVSAVYFLFGYSYVIYATFVVTALVKERGFTQEAAGGLWSWVGLLSLLSGPVLGIFSDRYGRKAGLVIVFCVQAVAYLLFASELPGMYLFASIALYGLVAWSIPGIIAALVGDYFGAKRAAMAFGLVTFIFGVGQMAGPAVAGFLAERSGGFSSSFTMAGAVAVAAVLLSSMLKSPEEVER